MKKHLFPRLSAPALCLLLLCALLPAALADVIWEPQNDFYEAHRDQCVYVGRTYLANGPEGYLVLTAAPDSGRVVTTFENGSALQVLFTYSGARGTWGVVEFRPEGKEDWVSGWFPMDEVLLQYDSRAFQEEHAGELTPCDAAFSQYAAADMPVVFWRYPGGPAEDGTVVPDASLSFTETYTDGAGRLWGRCGYYQGRRDFWVCLSDPSNPDLPVAEISYPDLVPPAAPPENPVPTAVEHSPVPALAAALVAGVVMVTLALLCLLRRKRRG